MTESNKYILTPSARLSVAPMMAWTDRHCRVFHRMISRQVLLYTEMVTAPALVLGGALRLLDFSPEEQPVALQLGGSDPAQLVKAVVYGLLQVEVFWPVCWERDYIARSERPQSPIAPSQSAMHNPRLCKQTD